MKCYSLRYRWTQIFPNWFVIRSLMTSVEIFHAKIWDQMYFSHLQSSRIIQKIFLKIFVEASKTGSESIILSQKIWHLDKSNSENHTPVAINFLYFLKIYMNSWVIRCFSKYYLATGQLKLLQLQCEIAQVIISILLKITS